MKDIDENNLDTAITLGTAVCNKLGLRGDKCGDTIFEIYQKLREINSRDNSIGIANTPAVEPEINPASREENPQTE